MLSINIVKVQCLFSINMFKLFCLLIRVGQESSELWERQEKRENR